MGSEPKAHGNPLVDVFSHGASFLPSWQFGPIYFAYLKIQAMHSMMQELQDRGDRKSCN